MSECAICCSHAYPLFSSIQYFHSWKELRLGIGNTIFKFVRKRCYKWEMYWWIGLYLNLPWKTSSSLGRRGVLFSTQRLVLKNSQLLEYGEQLSMLKQKPSREESAKTWWIINKKTCAVVEQAKRKSIVWL